MKSRDLASVAFPRTSRFGSTPPSPLLLTVGLAGTLLLRSLAGTLLLRSLAGTLLLRSLAGTLLLRSLAGTLLLLQPGPLFLSDLWAWVIVMAVCVAFACVWGRGFMPAASVASGRHALPSGLVSGGPTVTTSPCHTLPLVLVSVTDLSLGGLVCPWVRDVRAPGPYIGTS